MNIEGPADCLEHLSAAMAEAQLIAKAIENDPNLSDETRTRMFNNEERLVNGIGDALVALRQIAMAAQEGEQL